MKEYMTPRNNYVNEEILKYDKFYLIKENSAYKFIIGQLKNGLIIKCNNYEIKMNNFDLSILSESNIYTEDEAYQYIINIFEENNVIIKEIIINKSIKLLGKRYINNKEKPIEILLTHNKYNNYVTNNYMKINKEVQILKDDIKILKEEIKILKKEIKLLKDNNLKEDKIDDNSIKNFDKKDNNIKNPKNIEYLYDIVNDSYSYTYLVNTFSIFNSIDNILYLVYSNKKNSIILYNVIKNKKINEMQNAHNGYITNLRYYLDKINKRDLILSISFYVNNVKLWNIENNNINSIINIKNIYKNGYLFSACILNDNNNNYIITSNNNDQKCENIKIFDFNGNKIKEINNSNNSTNFIDIYYDNKLFKNYILTGNKGYIKSYDYNKNEIYKKYSDNDDDKDHFCIIINESKKEIKIIESSFDGNLTVWNFHSGELLKKIKISNEGLKEICMWNNEYIFIGCDDKTIKLIELEKGKIIKELKGHNTAVISIKAINLPNYGKCLVSQGAINDSIKLWIDNN